MKRLRIACLLILFVVLSAHADEAQVAKGLSVVIPGVTPEQIRKTPIEGLYEVTVGPRVIYVTADGRYVIQGELLDLVDRVNLTEPAVKRARLTALEELGLDNMIVFPAKQPTHWITVFSDIDCTYCRRMHADIDQYLNVGITVRYVFYPRSGVDTPSYDKAVSVWCAKDRKDALTRAKLKNEITPKTCDNPVRRHMALGEAFGVNGTPAIVTDLGTMVPGYVPAQQLQAYFKQQEALLQNKTQTN